MTTPPSAAAGTRFDGNEENKPEWVETDWNPPPAHLRKEEYDPKVNGPFLEEVRAEEAAVRAEYRRKNAEKEAAPEPEVLHSKQPGLYDPAPESPVVVDEDKVNEAVTEAEAKKSAGVEEEAPKEEKKTAKKNDS